jgi:molybdenum cofactor cytidylyltransferase
MTGIEMPQMGGLLLAAGGSRRLGQPKQLLEFEGKALLRHAAETLVSSVCDPIVVVLGAEFCQSQTAIADLPVAICNNEDWQSGISSSIRAGLGELLRIKPDLAAVMITLCDQPWITADHIDLFAAEFRRSGTSIIAAEYGGTLGVPALFSRELFAELLRLDGDKGARDLIRNSKNAKKISLEEAAFDIDLPESIEQV